MTRPWKPGEGQAIERLYAWIATEPDGGEGVCACLVGGVNMPLIGADLARVESLRPQARAVMLSAGCPVRLVEFSTRNVIRESPFG
jgi:hypothetical protein